MEQPEFPLVVRYSEFGARGEAEAEVVRRVPGDDVEWTADTNDNLERMIAYLISRTV